MLEGDLAGLSVMIGFLLRMGRTLVFRFELTEPSQLCLHIYRKLGVSRLGYIFGLV